MKRTLWILLAVVIVVGAPLAAYWGSSGHERLPEDEVVIWSNPAVTEHDAGPAFRGMFYDSRDEGFHRAVRPVATLVARLEWSQFYQGRAGYQWVQVFLLMLIGATGLVLFRRQTGSPLASLLGTLALLVHPLGSMSVLTMAGLSDLLALLFLLVSFAAAARVLGFGREGNEEWEGREEGISVGWMAIALVSLLLALWSKETAYAGVPVLVALSAAVAFRKDPDASAHRKRQALLFGAGVLAVCAIALVQRGIVLAGLPEHLRLGKAVTIDAGLGWGRRVFLGLVSLPSVLRLLFFPTDLGIAHDDLLNAGIPAVRAVAGLALLVLLGWTFLRSLGRSPGIAAWAGWTFFTLLGAIGLVGAVGDFLPQRILFQALPGIIALLLFGALSLRAVITGRTWRILAAAWVIIFVGFLGMTTWFRNRDFSDWDTLVHEQTSSVPRSAAGWFDSGNTFLARSEWSAAVDEYNTALKLRPDFWMAWVNLGTAYFGENEPGLAMRAFEKALDGTRNNPAFAVVDARANYNRALILMQQNRNLEAAKSLQRTLQIFPDHIAAHVNLGMIFSNSEKYDQLSLAHLRRAEELETDPERRASLDDVILRIQKRRADLNRRERVPLDVPADTTGTDGNVPQGEGQR